VRTTVPAGFKSVASLQLPTAAAFGAKNGTIRVRLTGKFPTHTFAKNGTSGSVTNFEFSDATGVIRGAAWNAEGAHFKALLNVGEVYDITNPHVRVSKMLEYGPNELTLSTTNDTTIRHVEDPTLPLVPYTGKLESIDTMQGNDAISFLALAVVIKKGASTLTLVVADETHNVELELQNEDANIPVEEGQVIGVRDSKVIVFPATTAADGTVLPEKKTLVGGHSITINYPCERTTALTTEYNKGE